jgi:redox-sensitive bicupin YhaK (pirin superfamily)
VSGPITTDDAPLTEEQSTSSDGLALLVGREATVGSLRVRRVLPQRVRRTVGAWCFADHMGPVRTDDGVEVGIGPHPHTGLQTVTWLLSGELLHLDSLGSEQPIRPGQLNLMTAGAGVVHAEEGTSHGGNELQGVQLWVAQPEETRHGPPAFEHHPELPQFELAGMRAIVLVGDLAGHASSARRDTDHIGADLVIEPPGTTVPLQRDYEYGLVVLEGAVSLGGGLVAEPGALAFLGSGRDERRLEVRAPARALLLGGVPFPDRLTMWWNFVGRSREELSEARRQWSVGDKRFGVVRSRLERIEVGPPPWESKAGSS